MTVRVSFFKKKKKASIMRSNLFVFFLIFCLGAFIQGCSLSTSELNKAGPIAD